MALHQGQEVHGRRIGKGSTKKKEDPKKEGETQQRPVRKRKTRSRAAAATASTASKDDDSASDSDSKSASAKQDTTGDDDDDGSSSSDQEEEASTKKRGRPPSRQGKLSKKETARDETLEEKEKSNSDEDQDEQDEKEDTKKTLSKESSLPPRRRKRQRTRTPTTHDTFPQEVQKGDNDEEESHNEDDKEDSKDKTTLPEQRTDPAEKAGGGDINNPEASQEETQVKPEKEETEERTNGSKRKLESDISSHPESESDEHLAKRVRKEVSDDGNKILSLEPDKDEKGDQEKTITSPKEHYGESVAVLESKPIEGEGGEQQSKEDRSEHKNEETKKEEELEYPVSSSDKKSEKNDSESIPPEMKEEIKSSPVIDKALLSGEPVSTMPAEDDSTMNTEHCQQDLKQSSGLSESRQETSNVAATSQAKDVPETTNQKDKSTTLSDSAQQKPQNMDSLSYEDGAAIEEKSESSNSPEQHGKDKELAPADAEGTIGDSGIDMDSSEVNKLEFKPAKETGAAQESSPNDIPEEKSHEVADSPVHDGAKQPVNEQNNEENEPDDLQQENSTIKEVEIERSQVATLGGEQMEGPHGEPVKAEEMTTTEKKPVKKEATMTFMVSTERATETEANHSKDDSSEVVTTRNDSVEIHSRPEGTVQASPISKQDDSNHELADSSKPVEELSKDETEATATDTQEKERLNGGMGHSTERWHD